MIYNMKVEDDFIYLFLATGSERNLKPDLVMDTFLKYMSSDSVPLHYHRLDVYAKNPEDKLVPLEVLRVEETL